MNSKKVAVIIPTLDPDADFMPYCRSLLVKGIERIIIVDDGSENKDNFDICRLGKEYEDRVVLLKHYVNLGKGRALKNAINYYMNMEDIDDFCGLITVDSDGQHSAEDVLMIKKELMRDQDHLILGIRDFSDSGVPYKSAFGNRMTRRVFRLLHGVKLKDTQTGLRAIPTQLAPFYIDLAGERFEYEMNMLIFSARRSVEITEIPISTIYKDGNSGTHFRPLKDSVAIYRLLLGTFLGYTFSSLSSFILDIAIFRWVFFLSGNITDSQTRRIFIATITARIMSSLFNYMINRNMVFQSKRKGYVTLVEYYILCGIQMILSAALVSIMTMALGISETLVKIIVDSCLFLISFTVQRKLIFKENII